MLSSFKKTTLTLNSVKFPSISVGDQVTVSTVIGFEDDDTLISSLAKKKTSYFEFALPQWSGYDDRGEIVWKWVRDAQDGVESSTAADDENSPLTIHPRVGKLQSGEKRVIHITFRPRWKHVLNKAAAEDRGKSSINSDSNAPLKLKQSTASALDSAELKDNIVNWKIPCFTSSASGAKIENDNDMVVFLQLEAFVTTPQFKLADAKSVKIDFGKVPVNEQSVQNVFLKCLLDRSVALSLRGLDPFGPFSVVEDLRELKPNYPAKYMLAFRPTSPIKFFETFEIASEDKATCISLKITGEGVLPSVVVEPRSKVLIVGDTLLGEHIQKSMAIHNVSPFSTKIRVNISTDGAHLFECSPTTATIAPGMRQEINVVFKPDHESDFLHAIALIHVEGFKKPLKMKVVGRCWSSSAFLTCDDETMVGRALATRPRDVENRTQMSSGDAILLEELLIVAERSTASATTEQQESSAEEWLKQVASVETKNAWKATSMVAAGKLSGRAAADVTQAMTRERGTGLATEISAAKPTHALLKLALPLASTVQPGTLLSSSSRCQFVSISCPWKQVNKSTVASDFSSLSGSVLSLNDRASVDTYATPLFRMDSRRITISNAKPGSATIATSLITLPADPKSIGAAGATFSVELVNDLNTLGPMAQIWLQRERALTSKNDAVVIKDHGLKFVVEPVSGTVDFGTQLSITIGMTGPKSERLTQDTMPIASKSSAKEDKDAASAVAVVRVPLAVESLFKVSIKGGVQIVERKQAQPSADGVYQTSYNVVAAGVEQPPGGNSPAYSDTFAKSVHEAANERVWLVRVVSSFEPEGKRERS